MRADQIFVVGLPWLQISSVKPYVKIEHARMSQSSSKSQPTGYPEFGVRRATISSFFSPQLASSTFHDLVKKGRIVPIKGLRGFYRLNDSLRRLGLREVPCPPPLPVDWARNS